MVGPLCCARRVLSRRDTDVKETDQVPAHVQLILECEKMCKAEGEGKGKKDNPSCRC